MSVFSWAVRWKKRNRGVVWVRQLVLVPAVSIPPHTDLWQSLGKKLCWWGLSCMVFLQVFYLMWCGWIEILFLFVGRTGSWTHCVISMRRSQSLRPSSSATLAGKSTGWLTRCTPVTSQSRLWYVSNFLTCTLNVGWWPSIYSALQLIWDQWICAQVNFITRGHYCPKRYFS